MDRYEDVVSNGGRTHTRTQGRTDAEVILYSVQCYALHWTDKYKKNHCTSHYGPEHRVLLKLGVFKAKTKADL